MYYFKIVSNLKRNFKSYDNTQPNLDEFKIKNKQIDNL